MGFNTSSPPSHYASVTLPARSGMFYDGDTVTLTLSQSGSTAYEVVDYRDNVVASGAVSGTSVNLGVLPLGWYRVRGTGPTVDAVYGNSYWGSAFMVMRDDDRFPANPAVGTGSGQGGGEAKDLILKGLVGLTSRHQISDASAPTSGADSIATMVLAAGLSATYWPDTDEARPRDQFCSFPNRTYDRIDLGPNAFARIYLKDLTIDGSKVFVKCDPGSSSGNRVRIYYPDASTLVEDYDNKANGTALAAAMNGTSAYCVAFHSGASVVTAAATAIGNAYHAGVTTTVTAGMAAGVTRYEGPINEPTLNAECAHRMKLFNDAVHAGDADAVSIGPVPVDITNLTVWRAFLDAAVANDCLPDELSFHAYNAVTNGDLNLGRHTIEAFLDMLSEYDLDTSTLWQTEATHVFVPVYGVLHPQRSRVTALQLLLWEQYGMLKEKNPPWYDRQHGFWSYPAFFGATDQSPVPYQALCRTIAEETYGMSFHHRVDFRSVSANAIFLGSVYRAASGESTVMVQTTSYMAGSQVVLTVSGVADGTPLVTVDGFGVEGVVTVTSGRVTLDVEEIPTWLRLPEDAHAWVYSVAPGGDDWGTTPAPSVSPQANIKTLGGVTKTAIADGGFMTEYATGTGIAYSTSSVPDTAIVRDFQGQAVTVDRVVTHCGPAWQNASVLVDYTVDTLAADLTTWTTRVTVNGATPSSVAFYTDSTNFACKRETGWPEQWVFSDKLPSPVSCYGVRLSVTAISFGGEPDAASCTPSDSGEASRGQGDSTPTLSLEEIAVLSSTTISGPTGSAPSNTRRPVLEGVS